MTANRYICLVSAFGLIIALGSSPEAQQGRRGRSELSDRLAKSRADVIKATINFKASLEKLVVFYESDIKTASEVYDRRKLLFEQGIISRREFEQAEKSLTELKARAADTRKQIVEADQLIAEVQAADKLDQTASPLTTTAALIRYKGIGKWSLTEAAKIEGFFLATFGQALPVSAFGQTAVHDRMGFDHRDAMDVAVHPDSAQGKALIEYLRGTGIPFLAFRHAVPGSATGPHIHIGNPSPRLLSTPETK